MASRDKTSVVLRLIQDGERDILDVGCGDGAMAERFHQLGKSVVGIEQDPEKAALAGRYCRTVLQWNLESDEPLQILDFSGERFDAILCSEILEHLREPAQVLRVLTRFLRPGGALIAVVPNVAFYKTRLMLLQGCWRYNSEGILDRTHLRFFTQETAEDLICGAGFTIVACEPTHYSRRFALLYDWLVRWRPSLFGEQFVIRAVLTG